MFSEFWQNEIKTGKLYLYNRIAASNHSLKQPTAQVMNVLL